MHRQIPQARQVLQKMVRGRLIFTPEARNGRPDYGFKGQGTLVPLLPGTVPELGELSHAVASPTGTEHRCGPRFRRVVRAARTGGGGALLFCSEASSSRGRSLHLAEMTDRDEQQSEAANLLRQLNQSNKWPGDRERTKSATLDRDCQESCDERPDENSSAEPDESDGVRSPKCLQEQDHNGEDHDVANGDERVQHYLHRHPP